MKRREEKQKLSDTQRAELKSVIDSLFEDDPDSPYERRRIKHQSELRHYSGLFSQSPAALQAMHNQSALLLGQQQSGMYQLMAQSQMTAQQQAALNSQQYGLFGGSVGGLSGLLGGGGLF